MDNFVNWPLGVKLSWFFFAFFLQLFKKFIKVKKILQSDENILQKIGKKIIITKIIIKNFSAHFFGTFLINILFSEFSFQFFFRKMTNLLKLESQKFSDKIIFWKFRIFRIFWFSNVFEIQAGFFTFFTKISSRKVAKKKKPHQYFLSLKITFLSSKRFKKVKTNKSKDKSKIKSRSKFNKSWKLIRRRF